MLHGPRRLSLVAVLCCAACGGKDTASPPGPLAIIARSPAPGTTGAEAGVTVTVGFNQAIDPATLTPTTLQVTKGGVALPAALSYDAATRTVSAGAPFLPESTYEVEVTTGVHTPAGAGLSAPDGWSFTTLAWLTGRADAAGDVGEFSSVATDADLRVHVSYFDYSSADLKYATCGGACAEPPSWDTVTVDATGNVGHNTSLAVDGSGRVHVTYQDGTHAALKYATCAAACATAANWDTVTVDAAGNAGYTAVAVDGVGRVHVAYQAYDLASGFNTLKYATCASACTTAANWDTVTVDATNDVGYYTSLAVDGSGRVHVGHRDLNNAALRYATCAAACSTAANWVTGFVSALGTIGTGPSLTVGSGGEVHVAFYAFVGGALRYGICATACSTTANWDTVTVDTPGTINANAPVVVNETGRVHVFYYDARISDFAYATCAGTCTTAANWRTLPVVAGATIRVNSSLAVDRRGRVHVTFYDRSNLDLKYLE
jgi:Bacterial Ig-like domain